MKRLIFTLFFAVFSMALVFAQEDILLEDFEDDEVSFTTMVNINPLGSMEAAIVDNPVKAGINTSNKVWEWKRVASATESPNWAGFWATLTEEIPAGYDRVEVKYLRTTANSQLKLKVEGGTNLEIDPMTPASKVNEWETMVFDLAGNGIQNITVLSLFPDYYEPVDLAAVTYVDDIMFFYGGSVIPPQSDSLVIFHDSADPRFHDQSWVSQTAPSTVVTEPFEPGAADGDKLPVVTDPFLGGTNALKLQFNSMEGGDWMAMVAATGWQLFDVSTFEHLKFWINSPAAMDSASLPLVYLESNAGTPRTTGKVRLADYLTAGLLANTWTEVNIPLADLWATDMTFTAKNEIKGVFFAQSTVGTTEHTLFLDEFSFHLPATGLDKSFKNNDLSVYFYNGELRFGNYSGRVQIYDVIGRKVAEGDVFDGTFRINLDNGLYIISTSKGSKKISF